MSHKQLLFHAAAREKVLAGATALADAVRVTLGPRSKSVLIGKKWGAPIVCNDGVTIAKELELKDPVEDLGARVIRQAAERTGDTVGDGTTTSTLIAHAIFAEGLRNVAAGASAIDLKRGLERGAEVAVKVIRDLSRPITEKREKVQVATISAHNDAHIGDLVGEAIDKVGKDGVITVEEAKGTETALDVVQGLQFDRGYLSAYFVTDPDRMECVLVDGHVDPKKSRAIVPSQTDRPRGARALGHRRFFGGFPRFSSRSLSRHESASMSRTWQCWAKRSTSALKQGASPKTVVHCL